MGVTVDANPENVVEELRRIANEIERRRIDKGVRKPALAGIKEAKEGAPGWIRRQIDILKPMKVRCPPPAAW